MNDEQKRRTINSYFVKLKDICSYLDNAIPLSFQESYDNSGLQCGSPESEISSGLITLDVTEKILDEAENQNCDLIISHHPVIFRELKRLTGRTATERIIERSLKAGIAIYSAHTNLDVLSSGVSRKMAEKLGLQNIGVLSPLKGKLLKLVTFIPDSHLDKVREAIFSAGAGVIGNYDSCGYAVHGIGSFRGNEESNPFTGGKGKLHYENEIRFETILFSYMKERVIQALLENHPYEEVAYDLYPLENSNLREGLGCTGTFIEPVKTSDFTSLLKRIFSARGIRYSAFPGETIRKVAVCGGSGSMLINDALGCEADAFVTADIKYHSFLEAGSRILLADIGHYESEIASKEILYDIINKKFPKFALRFSEVNTNPINYL